ncbi:serine hydrolase [Paenibacillus sp. BR2-3]|uniref:serine hydrolase domain-containing protein n=1 Tax=Paenibacillus sp. BR2-3 TaxID=3048494 RepID=UPI003977C7D7
METTTTSTNLQLPRSRPEEQGITSTAISDFLNAVHNKNLELHSFMLVRHGHVVAEGWWSPYRSNLPHMLYSLSKSFTSTAIGLAVSENLISLDDLVISFFPDEAPEVITPNLAKMNVRHLLMMGTGHVVETMEAIHRSEDGNWVKAFLGVPVEKEPGTHFLYNTGATYMLSAILQKVSGHTLLECLEPRLLTPLGIEGATWESCPRGINTGGFGLSLTTGDIAKFGQLYLQKGCWNNQRILPEAWINEATSKQISNGDGGDSDWTQGYGYQFWQCRHEAYRGDGAFGQFCIVLPEQDAVIAITSGTNDMQGVINAVWEHLLPAMQPEPISPFDASAAANTTAQLNLLTIHPPTLQLSSSLEETISGKLYKLDDNEQQWHSFSISFNNNEAAVTLQNALGEHIIHLGRGVWVESFAAILDGNLNRMMSSFTWITEDTLQLTLRFIETPYYVTVNVKVENHMIILQHKFNVSFDQTEPESTVGRA